MHGSMPCTGSPITCTSPELGRSRPEMRPRVVDLPQPVGPTTAQNSPGATLRETSSIAVYGWPVGVRKRLVTSRNSMADVARLVVFCVRADESVVIGRVVELLSRMVCWRHCIRIYAYESCRRHRTREPYHESLIAV